jgi:hypothetical protein
MSLGGLSSGLPADSVLAAQADALALIRAGHKANNDNDHQRAMACFEAAYVLSPQVVLGGREGGAGADEAADSGRALGNG